MAARPSSGPARPRSARAWDGAAQRLLCRGAKPPGCRAISTDTCVPISRLADCLLDSVAEADASGIPYFLVGHVGDGNFHFGYLIDPNDVGERERAEQLNHQLVTRALAMGGTCTGEHGVASTRWAFAGRGRRRRGGHDARHQARARPAEHQSSIQGRSLRCDACLPYSRYGRKAGSKAQADGKPTLAQVRAI